MSFLLTYSVDGPPVAWARAGRNKYTGRTFTKCRQGRAMTAHQLASKTAMKAAGLAMIPKGTPAHILVIARFALPASLSDAQRSARLMGAGYHTQAPDGSNILKLIEDSLNGLAYYDDSQIASATVSKCWAVAGLGKTTVTITSPLAGPGV